MANRCQGQIDVIDKASEQPSQLGVLALQTIPLDNRQFDDVGSAALVCMNSLDHSLFNLYANDKDVVMW